MGNSESFDWKGGDKKVSDLTNKEVVIILVVKKLLPFLTFITAYLPFSLLWRDRRFHNRYKEIVEADDRIVNIASKKDFWFKFLSFERDDRVTIITGKFIPLKKGADEHKLLKYFEKMYKRENIYVSKLDTETVKILFLKN